VFQLGPGDQYDITVLDQAHQHRFVGLGSRHLSGQPYLVSKTVAGFCPASFRYVEPARVCSDIIIASRAVLSASDPVAVGFSGSNPRNEAVREDSFSNQRLRAVINSDVSH
jgi:hypothetical protein